MNPIHTRRENGNVFNAPSCELVFNRDLTYNDGLMAQSYMKTYDLSFESATLEIQNGVRELKHRLHDRRHLELGQLGTFTMHDDKRFVYNPAPFIRPAFFGLDKATLKTLAPMQPKVVAMNSMSKKKRTRVASMSVAAVAIIAILLLFMPMSDATTRYHSARMLSETELFRSKEPVAQQPVVIEESTATEISEVNPVSPPHEDSPASLLDEEPMYYVVMGVFSGSETAQKMSDELHEKGFTRTGWLERSGRIDVYSASFKEEDAAKIYLKEIHGNYPAYSDAWILKR